MKKIKDIGIYLFLFLVLLTLVGCGKKTYSVQFYVDGNLYHEIETNGKTKVSLPDPPTKIAYTFEGWFFDDGSFDKPFTENSFVESPIISDTFIYSKWSKNKYTITFECNGGSEIGPITADAFSEISTPTSPIKEGYTFDGWYIDEDFNNQFDFQMPSENITIYAKWLINQYNITFLNRDMKHDCIDLYYNQEIIFPEDPEVEGYTFGGWYLDQNHTNLFTDIVMPANDIVVFAKWSVNQYTITFNSNDGTEVESITQDYSEPLLYPEEPIKPNYYFGGWFLDSECTEIFDFSRMPSSDITLYAKWNANYYRIYFNLDGGILENNIYVKEYPYNSVIEEPSEPTKSGFIFSGWYADSELTIPYVFTTMPGNDVNIYADWGTEGLEYTVNDDGNYAVSIGTATGSRIRIPQRYEGKLITKIADYGFYNNQNLEQFSRMPDTITCIGDYAFANNSNFFNFEFSKLETIGDYAFSDTSVQRVVFSDSLKTIGKGAFQNSNIHEITLPNSLTSVGDEAFDIEPLQSIFIPESVKFMGKNAIIAENIYCSHSSIPSTWDENWNQGNQFVLWNVKELAEDGEYKYALLNDDTAAIIKYNGTMEEVNDLIIKSEFAEQVVTRILQSAFMLCDAKTITIPDTVTKIDKGAFKWCYKLKSVVLPNNIIEISEELFYDCYSLESIEIPSSVKLIGRNAFTSCDSLQVVIVPDGVEFIGYMAFGYCENLRMTWLPSTVTNLDNTFNNSNNVLVFTELSEIPDDWGIFTHNYICNAKAITTNEEFHYVTFNDNTIGIVYCFEQVEPIIPSQIDNLPVTTVFRHAFSESTLKISLSESVINLEIENFYNYTSLSEIIVDENNSQYAFKDGLLLNKDETMLLYYLYALEATTFTIPETITTIGRYAFNNNQALDEVFIPSHVLNVDNHPFFNSYINRIYVSFARGELPTGWNTSWYNGLSSETTIEYEYDFSK